MKKFLLVALAFLVSSSAFGRSSFMVSESEAKGSWHVTITNNGTTKQYVKKAGYTDARAFGVNLITGGTPGDETCATSLSLDYCAYEVDAGATTVEVRVSGKVTGFGAATGSGSTLFTYAGTGVNVSLVSKAEHGLAFVPLDSSCQGQVQTDYCGNGMGTIPNNICAEMVTTGCMVSCD